jgi:hypothetical protein
MRPNTPYAVLTVQHSLSKGGYFYATSTMMDSLEGKMHSFILHKHISGPPHNGSKTLIRRMISFYHMALVKGEVEPEGQSFVSSLTASQRTLPLQIRRGTTSPI